MLELEAQQHLLHESFSSKLLPWLTKSIRFYLAEKPFLHQVLFLISSEKSLAIAYKYYI